MIRDIPGGRPVGIIVLIIGVFGSPIAFTQLHACNNTSLHVNACMPSFG